MGTEISEIMEANEEDEENESQFIETRRKHRIAYSIEQVEESL